MTNIIKFKLKKQEKPPIRVYEPAEIEDEVFGARLARIRMSLNRINELMADLKQIGDNTNENNR